ncbi:MAG: hypothetical protein ABJQ70_14215 [Roseobacter sp.]
MSDTKKDHAVIHRFDRPSETIVTKNTEHAPWHDVDDRHNNDKSHHRRYHSLFEDLMN